MNRLLGAPGLALLLLSVARADDWTQFRGTHRDAAWSEKGLLESFPPEGLKVCWRVPAEGGFSSPVVSHGRVYLIDAELQAPKARERIRCFEEKTGAVLWTYSYEVHYDESWFRPGMKDGPRATPIVQDGKLFSIGSDTDLACLDALQGTVLWKKTLHQEYDLGDHRCITPSPLIEGNLLIQVCGAKPKACVIAFDKDSGKEVWRALEDRWTYSSPIVIEAGGKRQLIVWTAQAVTSLDPLTGRTYWREEHDLLSGGYSIVATPVQRQDLLLVSGMMFRLDPDKPTATLLWPEPRAVSRKVLSSTSMPLIQGDCVYSEKGNGALVCMEARTGKQLWKSAGLTAAKGGAALHLTPNGDSVWILTDQGNLIRARLSPEGCQELSRTHLLDPTYVFGDRKVLWSPPAFANRHIFARSEQELICASLAALSQ
jgi:outer membrane protein assembly factor BamB